MTDDEIKRLWFETRALVQREMGDGWTHEEVDRRSLRAVFVAGYRSGCTHELACGDETCPSCGAPTIPAPPIEVESPIVVEPETFPHNPLTCLHEYAITMMYDRCYGCGTKLA